MNLSTQGIYTYDVTEGASHIHYMMTSSKVRRDRDLGAHAIEVRVLAIYRYTNSTDRYIPNGEIYRSNAIKGICRFISCTLLRGAYELGLISYIFPGRYININSAQSRGVLGFR